MNKQDRLASELHKCYDLIVDISNKSGILRWRDLAVPYLSKRTNIKPMPFWFPTGWSKRTLATTASTKLIYITDLFFEKNIEHKCAVLLHEAVHIQQYHEKKLSWSGYIFNRHKRNTLEKEAYDEGAKWIRTWRKYVNE